jgi:hypothetical protein
MTVPEAAPRGTDSIAEASSRSIAAALAATDLGARPDRDLAYARLSSELSRHLIGMEVAVWPTYLHHFPGGRAEVNRLLGLGRRIESVIHDIESTLRGDARFSAHVAARMRGELVDLVATYQQEETRLLGLLHLALSAEDRAGLAARFEAARRHAPTRPHPHAVRRLSWSRLLYRPVAAFDRLLDVLDSRPAVHEAPRRRPPGKWGSYFLGRPLTSDAARKDVAGH